MTDSLLSLADDDLRSIAVALRTLRLAPPFGVLTLQRLISPASAEVVSSGLQALTSQGFSPEQISTVIEMLARDRSARPRVDDLIELVTTGPQSSAVASRDTAVVVRELFSHANHTVMLVGYAVYKGLRVFEALSDRMEERPDLKVKMFLDVRRERNDTTVSADIVRRFIHRFKTKDWPAKRRMPEVFYDPRALSIEPSERASLHAKCVVVDGATAFVSSANFTEAAQQRNLEVGLLMQSSNLAGRLCGHFEALINESALLRAF